MISNKLKRLRLFFIVLLTGFLLTACGGGGSSDSSVSSSGADQGTLQLALVDASSGSYKAVYVTIARVEVHLGGDEDVNGNWLVVAEPNKTYNLLELVNGVREDLGLVDLDAGLYSQMRLIIGSVASPGQNILSEDHPHANYVIDEDDDEIHKLKVPSEVVKIVKGFEINADQTTELILDFDAMRSVVTRGKSGKDYILKPTIKVRTESEAVIVKGTVTDVTDPPTASVPLAGSLVTAQTTEELAVDPKDEVVIETGTIADDDGEYALFIAPGNYNFVATYPGYDPACVTATLSSGDSAVIDFGLVENDPLPGTVSVKVTITGDDEDDEQYATVDFRSEIDCIDDDLNAFSTWVTVATINIANGSDPITLDLPVGAYEVVASSYGLDTQVQPVTVESEQDTLVEITFD